MESVGIPVCERWFLGRGYGRSGVEKGLRRKRVLDSAVTWGTSLVSVNPCSDVMWYSLGIESFNVP
jgi:hypothetical protein